MITDGTYRILYVDDEPDIQEIVGMALELVEGTEVKTCGSGRAALALAVDFHPDIILLDVMMPDMDGPATLRELRSRKVTAAIPVVFVTAKAQSAEVRRYRELGVADVIAKPFDPLTLGDQVVEILRRIDG